MRAPLSLMTVPALVIHGTADPILSLKHGVTLANETPTHGRCDSMRLATR